MFLVPGSACAERNRRTHIVDPNTNIIMLLLAVVVLNAVSCGGLGNSDDAAVQAELS